MHANPPACHPNEPAPCAKRQIALNGQARRDKTQGGRRLRSRRPQNPDASDKLKHRLVRSAANISVAVRPRKLNSITTRRRGIELSATRRRIHHRRTIGSSSFGRGLPNAQRAPHPPNTSMSCWSSRPAGVSRYWVCLSWRTRRSSTPVRSRRRSRSTSNARDMCGRPRSSSLKRSMSARSSRTISTVQRSARISAALATGQYCP